MTTEEAFEQIANLLDGMGVSADDAMKMCAAICIAICIDSGKPKGLYIQYMSEAWNHFAATHKQFNPEVEQCH